MKIIEKGKIMFTEEEINFMKKYVGLRGELITAGVAIFDEPDIKIYSIFTKILKELEEK
jgi:hypothetical protein